MGRVDGVYAFNMLLFASEREDAACRVDRDASDLCLVKGHFS